MKWQTGSAPEPVWAVKKKEKHLFLLREFEARTALPWLLIQFKTIVMTY
jgi:hypothetical protein